MPIFTSTTTFAMSSTVRF